MIKKVILTLLTLFIIGSIETSALALNVKPLPATLSLKASQISDPESYYVWVLFDNGCYYLYKVTVFTASNDSTFQMEFWEPATFMTWAGSTVNCVYSQEEMETIC